MTDKHQEFFDELQRERERLRQGSSGYRHDTATLAYVYSKKEVNPLVFLDRSRTLASLVAIYPNHCRFKLEDVAKFLDMTARRVYTCPEEDFTDDMFHDLNKKREQFNEHGLLTTRRNIDEN